LPAEWRQPSMLLCDRVQVIILSDVIINCFY
jgi:hypothetical protein